MHHDSILHLCVVNWWVSHHRILSVITEPLSADRDFFIKQNELHFINCWPWHFHDETAWQNRAALPLFQFSQCAVQCDQEQIKEDGVFCQLSRCCHSRLFVCEANMMLRRLFQKPETQTCDCSMKISTTNKPTLLVLLIPLRKCDKSCFVQGADSCFAAQAFLLILAECRVGASPFSWTWQWCHAFIIRSKKISFELVFIRFVPIFGKQQAVGFNQIDVIVGKETHINGNGQWRGWHHSLVNHNWCSEEIFGCSMNAKICCSQSCHSQLTTPCRVAACWVSCVLLQGSAQQQGWNMIQECFCFAVLSQWFGKRRMSALLDHLSTSSINTVKGLCSMKLHDWWRTEWTVTMLFSLSLLKQMIECHCAAGKS